MSGELATGKDIESAIDHSKTYAPVGITMMVIGGALVATGTALFFTSGKPASDAPKSARASLNGMGFVW